LPRFFCSASAPQKKAGNAILPFSVGGPASLLPAASKKGKIGVIGLFFGGELNPPPAPCGAGGGVI